MGEKDLNQNIDFVEKNRESLLQEHEGKYLLVYDGSLVGSFDTYQMAAGEGVRLYGMDGNFLVHHLVQKEPVNFIMEAAI